MAKPRNKSGSNQIRSNVEETELSADVVQQLGAIELQLGTLAADYSTLATVGAQTADTTPQIQSSLQQVSGLLESLTGGLERFEDRLTIRLEDVIRDAIAREALDSSHEGVPQAAALQHQLEPVAAEPAIEAKKQDSATPEPAPVAESWEAIRKAMLEAAEDPEPASNGAANAVEEPEFAKLPPAIEQAEPESEPAPKQEAAPVSTIFEEFEACELSAPIEFDLPQAIDYSLIQDETVRDSVIAMENLMRSMAEKLRQRIKLASPISTVQLHELRNVLPEEFRSRVDSSLTLLDEQLRLTELELSLERARVARQITKLEESEHILRNTATQLGYTLQEDGGLHRTLDEGSDGSTERRWTRVLGFGR